MDWLVALSRFPPSQRLWSHPSPPKRQNRRRWGGWMDVQDPWVGWLLEMLVEMCKDVGRLVAKKATGMVKKIALLLLLLMMIMMMMMMMRRRRRRIRSKSRIYTPSKTWNPAMEICEDTIVFLSTWVIFQGSAARYAFQKRPPCWLTQAAGALQSLMTTILGVLGWGRGSQKGVLQGCGVGLVWNPGWDLEQVFKRFLLPFRSSFCPPFFAFVFQEGFFQIISVLVPFLFLVSSGPGQTLSSQSPCLTAHVLPNCYHCQKLLSEIPKRLFVLDSTGYPPSWAGKGACQYGVKGSYTKFSK